MRNADKFALILTFAAGWGLAGLTARGDSLLPGAVLAEAIELTWEQLTELNFRTGIVSKKLAEIDQRKIKIPGFMIPLDDEVEKLTDFLFVPSPQACIHVPPPPPNQMILVHVAAAKAVIFTPRAVMLEGVLHIDAKENAYGKASFSLEAEKVTPY